MVIVFVVPVDSILDDHVPSEVHARAIYRFAAETEGPYARITPLGVLKRKRAQASK